jgi:HK97 gp10 family phage protein
MPGGGFVSTNLSGVDDLMRLLRQVETVPARTMTTAVKKAANIAKAEAKSLAPTKTGDLKRSIGIYAEKLRVGKKVYQLAFNKNYNEKFVKVSADGKRSYYPASQEYGFKTRSGGKVQGKFFLKKASKDKIRQLEQMIVDELANSLRSLGGG